MVLLTSSAVTVAISSSVVCLFTFLLFLSGYVLQQQTVKALQEALRQPPERRPVPTLPPQFQHLDNDSIPIALEGQSNGADSATGENHKSEDAREDLISIQVSVLAQDANQAVLAESETTPIAPEPGQNLVVDAQTRRLAYIFALLEPTDLCSALLFARQQRSFSQLMTEPSIVLLYPSTWETEGHPLQSSALSFMRDVQDLYDLIYHPVEIRSEWDIRAQLLGELQWKHWDYDQALYLRSPGLVLDSKALDDALDSSSPKGSWAPLNPSSGDNPDVLLLTPKGLQSPRKQMRRLAMPAMPPQTGTGDENEGDEDVWRRPAYVLLEGEGGRPSQADNESYRDILRRFDRGRKSVCAGSGLLDGSPGAGSSRSWS